MRFLGHPDRVLGLLAAIFALLVIFVWAPLDSGSGLVETVRRRTSIGDAMGPVVAGVIIALGALLTIARPSHPASPVTLKNLAWIAVLFAVFAVSLALMRYTGPVLAVLLTEGEYRPLRNTVPWKYLGFMTGGAVLIAGTGLAAARRVSWTPIIIGLLAAIVIALLYELPFEDVLLPPNGSV